jgi:uncharacterized membrane protein
MNLARFPRFLRHLFATSVQTHRCFPTHALAAIESEIHAAESRHSGELRFAVEAALDVPMLSRGITPRQRALDVFSHLRVWDTARNNGVLIYVLLADHDVEIVADRGFDGRVRAEEWEAACQVMEKDFRERRYKDGALAGVRAVGNLIARHFPPEPRDVNELPNRPVIL